MDTSSFIYLLMVQIIQALITLHLTIYQFLTSLSVAGKNMDAGGALLVRPGSCCEPPP